MIGTILSIIIAIAIYFIAPIKEHAPLLNVMAPFLLATPLLFLFLQVMTLAMAFAPLQKAEQNLTPRILELFKKDSPLKLINAGLVLFTLFSFFIALDALYLDILPKNILILIWIVTLGVGIDLIHKHISRIFSYLNPFSVVKLFTHAGRVSISQDRELDLCDSIESLSEVGVKSLHRSSTSLCNNTIDEMREIIRIFLTSSASIAHETQDKQSKEMGITDKVSYTLFYFFGRIELLFQKALEQNLETVCSNIISTLGKVILYAAKYDLSLVSFPVHQLGKFTRKAQDQKMPDMGLKGTCTLLEIAKAIVNEIDLTYMELQDPFFSIITQLDEIAKETFRLDKSSNIKLLTQPFRDLKDLFLSEKLQQHQDSAVIIGDIDRVMAEWDALEMVLRTIPPIPNIPEEQTSGGLPTPEQLFKPSSEKKESNPNPNPNPEQTA